MRSTDLAIQTQRLTKRYGSHVALRDVDISLPEAVIAGLIGPNGAGKTTLLRILLGLVRPTAGVAQVFGESVRQPGRFVDRVGAIVERPAFYTGLSARSNLEVLCSLGGLDRRRIPAVLATSGLFGREDDPVRSYSLGMRQRLAVAAALLNEPRLLILDEPLNGLDPDGIRELRGLLQTLRDQGATCLVSSHVLAEIEHVASWLILLKDGRCRYCGPIATLPTDHSQDALIVALSNPEDLPRLRDLVQADGFTGIVDGSRLRIDAPVEYAKRLNEAAMAAGLTLIEIAPIRRTLETSYLELMAAKDD